MKLAILLALLLYGLTGQAQDGKLLEQQPYTLHDSSVKKLSASNPEIKKWVAGLDLYRISYASDGLKIKGFVSVPKGAGKFPCVIFNRGGNPNLAVITEESFFRIIGQLSNAGYVVIASQYRQGGGSEGKDEFGGKDVNDVLNLFPVLSAIPKADTSRIGMFGWSRGGMMTYLALTRTRRIKAAVVGSGMTDLRISLSERPAIGNLWSTLIPGYLQNRDSVFRLRSATAFADQVSKTTPILILQGTADWRVGPAQVFELVKKFYEVKQPFRFILYEGAQHSLAEFRQDYTSQVIQWFHHYLRDGKPWPSLEPHGD